MNSIQEIFRNEFADAAIAVVQKLYPDQHNLGTMDLAFTESWPPLALPARVFALSLGDAGSRRRTIHAGLITDVQPSSIYDGRFRFYVDRFRNIGVHDLDQVADGIFYGNGGGGGSRTYVRNEGHSAASPRSSAPDLPNDGPEGTMELRLGWVRKNHNRFRDPVWRHWEGRCAVNNVDCNGMLVASHIFPWARSTPREKTDPNNGLLLSVPIDKLFDRGWISFSDSGAMLIKSSLSLQTRSAFGITNKAQAIQRMEKITPVMQAYLKRHRQFHGFDPHA